MVRNNPKIFDISLWRINIISCLQYITLNSFYITIPYCFFRQWLAVSFGLLCEPLEALHCKFYNSGAQLSNANVAWLNEIKNKLNTGKGQADSQGNKHWELHRYPSRFLVPGCSGNDKLEFQALTLLQWRADRRKSLPADTGIMHISPVSLRETHFDALAGQMEFWCIAAFVLLAQLNYLFHMELLRSAPVLVSILKFMLCPDSGLRTTDAGCGCGLGLGNEDNISHSPEEMVIYINIKSDVGHILQDQLPVTVCLFAQQPQGHQPSFCFQQWQWWQKKYKTRNGNKNTLCIILRSFWSIKLLSILKNYDKMLRKCFRVVSIWVSLNKYFGKIRS